MYRAATIKDIANELGFSISTISRALRNSHEVSAEKKERIIAYAKEINYYSNPAARSLKNRRSYSVGVMVPDVANNFFSQTMNGIESIAYEKGYHVIITQSHESYEREVLNLEHLANSSVDGLLISVSSETIDYSHIKKFHVRGLPIVFFDRIIDEIKTHKVTIDNFKASFDATELLIKKGYKRIAFLAHAPQLSVTTERLAGYKAALRQNYIKVNDDMVKYCFAGGREPQEVYHAIENLLSWPKSPEALVIANDRLSIAAIRLLNKHYQTQGMAIMGFSNSDVIDLITPQISYVRQNAFEMGEIAMEMLIKLMNSRYPVYDFETKFVDTEICMTDQVDVLSREDY
jgi:LacI family transcriptional regulator